MNTYKSSSVTIGTISPHAQQRMVERLVNLDDLLDAAADAVLAPQPDGRTEVRGLNGIAFILAADGEVVTVLWPGLRPAATRRANAGVSGHRPGRRGPKGRTDKRHPKR